MPTPDRPSPQLLASLPELRAKLEEQRQFRIEQLAMLGKPVDDRRPHSGLLDQPEPDPPDPDPRGPDQGHREIAEALAAGARQVLANIETALNRMHTGRYGSCLRCGMPIGVERLRLIPYLAMCEDCQR
jgi:RNA polymerase-binding transcription factor DksA